MNKKFAVGGDDPDNMSVSTEFNFPSGGSYLMGFWGAAEQDIDNLGIYMMKPLQSEEIVNTTYTIVKNPNREPKSLKKEEFTNNTPEPTKLTLAYEKTTSSTKSWTTTNSFSSKSGLKVSGKIPVVDISIEASLELTESTESSATNEVFMETKSTETREINTPGCSKGMVNIVNFEYREPVEYSGQLKYTFKDNGGSFSLPVSGTYQSVYVSETKTVLDFDPIAGGLCAGTPVASPVMDTPVAAPVVGSPVAAPVVGAPVAAPVVGTPVAAPVVGAPASSPVIAGPTVIAPTVDSPTGPTPPSSDVVAPLVYIANAENVFFNFNAPFQFLPVQITSKMSQKMSKKQRRLGGIFGQFY
jgi:hypothetical protein